MIITLNPNAAHIMKVGTESSGFVSIKIRSSLPISAFLTSDENAIYLEQHTALNPQNSVMMFLQNDRKAETNVYTSVSYNNLVLLNQNTASAFVELEIEDLKNIRLKTCSFPTSAAGTTGMGF